MPRMLYINCSGPTSRSRSLSMRRLPRSRKEKEGGEGTFVGHGRSDSDSGRTHAGRGSGNRVPGNSGKVKVCDSSASRSSRPRLYAHIPCRKGSCGKIDDDARSKRGKPSSLDSDKSRYRRLNSLQERESCFLNLISTRIDERMDELLSFTRKRKKNQSFYLTLNSYNVS